LNCTKNDRGNDYANAKAQFDGHHMFNIKDN